MKERIFCPATVCLISGLKTGERVQVRLRPIAEDGSARDWRAGDWIEGVSSVDTEEIIEALDEEIRNSDAFKVLKDGWSFEKNGTLIINNGQGFITDAKISDRLLSTNYSVKLNVAGKGKPHEAGMTLGIEGDQSKVEFLADRYKVHEAASSIIENAVATSAKTKIRLGDEMKSAVIDAVRESKQFVENEVANAESLKAEQVIFLADRFKVLGMTGDAMSIIENAVLSDLLVNVLSKDHCPVDGLEAKAIKLTKAVQAAFNALVQEDATAN
ncbi:TPA: DUF1983 domain-containing protein [Enterobacter hormaechei subsp. hoffmannii]|nr:DUF1983 domain-containing protein [Enterobacter hormaechei subsp. hoffmannii]